MEKASHTYDAKAGCPSRNRKCNSCKNMAIRRSIDQALKKVSLVGKAAHIEKERRSNAIFSVERPYSQIERETLAIIWGCTYLLPYVPPIGTHFKVVTDHKPLLSIFNSPTSQTSARIENWRLKLQSSNFDELCSRGAPNPADSISRHFQGDTKCNLIAESLPSCMSYSWCLKPHLWLKAENDISDAARKNATLQEVMRLISASRWNNLKPVEGVDPNTLQIFTNIHSELASSGW